MNNFSSMIVQCTCVIPMPEHTFGPLAHLTQIKTDFRTSTLNSNTCAHSRLCSKILCVCIHCASRVLIVCPDTVKWMFQVVVLGITHTPTTVPVYISYTKYLIQEAEQSGEIN